MASNGSPAEMAHRLGHQFGVRDPEGVPARLGQRVLQQQRVGRIVFDQQQADGRWIHDYSPSGSLTTVSQKSSIDFTTSMKRVKSTGLVM